MRYGYARVSTREQNEARQIEALERAGIDRGRIFIDKASGADADRPALNEVLGLLTEGDSLTVLSFDRLARSTKHLLGLADDFAARGIDLISIREGFDTSTPQGKFFFTVTAAFAEMEREIIRERQAEGIAIAKRDGRMKGRPTVDKNALSAALSLYREGELSVAQIVKATGISRTTIYREAAKRGITRK